MISHKLAKDVCSTYRQQRETSRVCEELLQINMKRQTTQKKSGQNLKGYFTEKKSDNIFVERCSTPLEVQEIQMMVTMRCPLS